MDIYDIYTDDDYVTWLAGYHPDALPDYVNPDDSAPQHRSDPFQLFEDYDQVGNDGEVHHLGDNLEHSVGDMETGNNGTPNSDKYKSSDKVLGEGNMETESDSAPRPDDSKSDDKELGEGNMETERSETPCTDISKSDGKASGEETESNGASRPDDLEFDPQSTTSIQEKEHSKESITPSSKVLTHSRWNGTS